MVKYFALFAVVVVSLVAADVAEARGRRGCSTCATGGCYGGECALPVAPAPVKAAVVAPESGAPVAATPAPTYYTGARRGLFGRRR